MAIDHWLFSNLPSHSVDKFQLVNHIFWPVRRIKWHLIDHLLGECEKFRSISQFFTFKFFASAHFLRRDVISPYTLSVSHSFSKVACEYYGESCMGSAMAMISPPKKKRYFWRNYGRNLGEIVTGEIMTGSFKNWFLVSDFDVFCKYQTIMQVKSHALRSYKWQFNFSWIN